MLRSFHGYFPDLWSKALLIDIPLYHQGIHFILTLISFLSQLRQKNIQLYPTKSQPQASGSMPQYSSSLGIPVLMALFLVWKSF